MLLSPSLLLCSIWTILVARRATAQSLLTSTDDARCVGPSFLSPGQHLYANNEPRHICSPNGLYRFGLDTNIGIVLERTGELVWSAGQERGIDTDLAMQGDGNLVLRAATIQGALWTSKTEGNYNAVLYLEDDGQVRIRAPDGAIIWETDAEENCGHIPGSDPPELVVDSVVDASTLHGKIMAGYQGWFDTPCSDYKQSRWRHWAHLGGPAPDPSAYQFEMWPDLREFDDDELCPTGFTYPDGRTAGLFSSYNTKSVDRHVRWMSDYNIDGVFFQRFISKVKKERCFEDKVLDNVRRGAERHGRVFAAMFDIGKLDAAGKRELTVYDGIRKDWVYLVDVQEITKSSSYLHHNGRPVLSLWGFGILNRPGEPDAVAELVDWFKNNPVERYRVTLKGGVAKGWQDLGASAKKDPAWAAVYRMFDIISPWSVGRMRNEADADAFSKEVTIPNARECEALGIDYMPVVFPGFSWSYKNLRDPSLQEPFNKYPRRGGKFFWRQIYNSISAFSPTVAGKQVYVAMFDEVDEATAVMKTAETGNQVPTDGQFLTLDADGYSLPSDWFLRLIGHATDMLRTKGAVPISMPELPPTPSRALPDSYSEETAEPSPKPTNAPDATVADITEVETFRVVETSRDGNEEDDESIAALPTKDSMDEHQGKYMHPESDYEFGDGASGSAEIQIDDSSAPLAKQLYFFVGIMASTLCLL